MRERNTKSFYLLSFDFELPLIELGLDLDDCEVLSEAVLWPSLASNQIHTLNAKLWVGVFWLLYFAAEEK